MSNFDPIPRLQQIAATIEESGADIFDAPATAVHYIECAIKEIERLRKELYEAQIIAVHQSALLLKKSPKEIADQMNWNCLDDKDNITA